MALSQYQTAWLFQTMPGVTALRKVEHSPHVLLTCLASFMKWHNQLFVKCSHYCFCHANINADKQLIKTFKGITCDCDINVVILSSTQ